MKSSTRGAVLAFCLSIASIALFVFALTAATTFGAPEEVIGKVKM